MEILEIHGRQPDTRAISAVTDALRSGGIAIIPTDTLYGLVCDGLNTKAIEKLCRIKGLTEKHLLSIICNDFKQAAHYARIDNRAFMIMRESLPGPITYVLPSSNTLPKAFKGRKTVGIRIPDNDFARAIAEELDGPVMCTSVECEEPGNPDSVEWSYESNEEVAVLIKSEELSGVPSMIIDLQDSSNPEIIRQ